MNGGVLQISPSASSRWLQCSSSPSFILKHRHDIVEEDTSSSYADEGTLAHDLAAEALLIGYDEEAFEDEEMAKHVKGYIDYIQSMRRDGDTMLIETKLQPWYLIKEAGYDGQEIDHVTHGFSDCTIYGPGRLVVIDLKYGAGISVQAEKNTQMTIYAMSVLMKLLKKGYKLADDDEVVLAIYQPRVYKEEAVRDWVITGKELREFASHIFEKAKDILRGENTEFYASEKTCRFCPAKAFCKVHAGWVLGEEVFEDIRQALKLDLPSPDAIEKQDLVELYRVKDDITTFLKDVEKHLFGVVNAGNEDLGLKMVQSYGNRAFEDPAAAEKYLRQRFKKDEVLPGKLVSPAQAEALFKKHDKKPPKAFQDMIIKPKKGPALAWKEDKRPALVIDPAEEFEVVE